LVAIAVEGFKADCLNFLFFKSLKSLWKISSSIYYNLYSFVNEFFLGETNGLWIFFWDIFILWLCFRFKDVLFVSISFLNNKALFLGKNDDFLFYTIYFNLMGSYYSFCVKNIGGFG
jgi:hypothetical protein